MEKIIQMFQTTNQLFIIIPTDLQFFLHLQLLLELLELSIVTSTGFLGIAISETRRNRRQSWRLEAMKYS
jgi:hypothetical protein